MHVLVERTCTFFCFTVFVFEQVRCQALVVFSLRIVLGTEFFPPIDQPFFKIFDLFILILRNSTVTFGRIHFTHLINFLIEFFQELVDSFLKFDILKFEESLNEFGAHLMVVLNGVLCDSVGFGIDITEQ
jgi:hypothetical protein